MSTGSSKPVSELRVRWKGSDQQALQALKPLVYGELRRVAHPYLQAEKRPNHTLRSTELVHEAYLRLVDQQPAELPNRAHFFAVSARLTREILVDYARSRRAVQRGGCTITLDDAVATTQEQDVDDLRWMTR